MLSLLANDATDRPTLVTPRLPNLFHYGLGMFWKLNSLTPSAGKLIEAIRQSECCDTLISWTRHPNNSDIDARSDG
jgi:hypothetical protein